MAEIERELGHDVACSVADVVWRGFAGERVRIPVARWVTSLRIDQAAPGKPQEAAQSLGISRATAYRRISRIVR
jgi:hypothetical protein